MRSPGVVVEGGAVISRVDLGGVAATGTAFNGTRVLCLASVDCWSGTWKSNSFSGSIGVAFVVVSR